MKPNQLPVDWLQHKPAPEVFNKPTLIHFFQMLCPACVLQSLPTLEGLWRSYKDINIMALHSVFEHHDVMTPKALEVFMHEFAYSFPVAIDQSSYSPIPKTMAHFNVRGTPSTLILDPDGEVLFQHFGVLTDNQYQKIIQSTLQKCGPQGCPVK